jgi:hypothetical protein
VSLNLVKKISVSHPNSVYTLRSHRPNLNHPDKYVAQLANPPKFADTDIAAAYTEGKRPREHQNSVHTKTRAFDASTDW